MHIRTRAAIRNIHTVPTGPAEDRDELVAYGLQFIDLDPNHYMLLQNLTYETLLADRSKIV